MLRFDLVAIVILLMLLEHTKTENVKHHDTHTTCHLNEQSNNDLEEMVVVVVVVVVAPLLAVTSNSCATALHTAPSVDVAR
jgi:hypothetical protein